MPKIDWSTLGTSLKGVAVEGKDDKTVIEAFLDGGEQQGFWSNWRGQVAVEVTGSSQKVLNELEARNPRIWGLIDRDWRTDQEISDLQAQYPQLLVLPRITIENYCIAPTEIIALLPGSLQSQLSNLAADIGQFVDDWVANGALWQVLYEHGANDFCRGADGYPKALLNEPVIDLNQIQAQLTTWHQHLEPQALTSAYQTRLATLQQQPHNHFTQHIQGKNFFNQIIVSKLFNPMLGQRSRDDWFNDLFSAVSMCPQDLVPILKQVVQ